jgi:HSP20 family protein
MSFSPNIKCERKFEEETKKENYHRVERSYGEFVRSFTLPSFADPNKINADYKDGTLRVSIAKREEVRPKQIEVKSK